MTNRDTKLVLTVELHVPNDPDPGEPWRIAQAMARIARSIRGGNTAGQFDQTFTYSSGGEPNTDHAMIDWRVAKVRPTVRSLVDGADRSEGDR